MPTIFPNLERGPDLRVVITAHKVLISEWETRAEATSNPVAKDAFMKLAADARERLTAIMAAIPVSQVQQ